MTTKGPVGHDQRIVVGIDGSEPALRALAWAVTEAQARSWTVEVVHAWDYNAVTDFQWDSAEEAHTASSCLVSNEVAAVVRGLADPPQIVQTNRRGPAAKVLLATSKGAALLVVGRGRHRMVRDLMMDSVSAAVVRGAECPVLIVPESASTEPEAVLAASASVPGRDQ